jgi:phage FluMu protein Com
MRKGVYNPKAFFLHAVLLRQAFTHCGKFLTAASHRSLFRVSVPVWLIIFSNQLLIKALVSHYLTNKLIRCKLVSRRNSLTLIKKHYEVLANVSKCYSSPKRQFLHVTHPSATILRSFGLHVLSIPPAFILSKDQTLHIILILSFRKENNLSLTGIEPTNQKVDDFESTVYSISPQRKL